jgi:hypothetical protein
VGAGGAAVLGGQPCPQLPGGDLVAYAEAQKRVT